MKTELNALLTISCIKGNFDDIKKYINLGGTLTIDHINSVFYHQHPKAIDYFFGGDKPLLNINKINLKFLATLQNSFSLEYLLNSSKIIRKRNVYSDDFNTFGTPSCKQTIKEYIAKQEILKEMNILKSNNNPVKKLKKKIL